MFLILLYDEQAPQPILIRHVTNCSQRKATSSWSHRQLLPWSSASNEQYTMAVTSVVRHLVPAQHQHWHHRLTGVGSRPATRTSLDNATQSFQDLSGACLFQMQRRLCEKVHMEAGQTGIHTSTTVCLWQECSQNQICTLRRRFSTLPDSIWRLNSELLCILHVLINMIINSVPWPQIHLTWD